MRHRTSYQAKRIEAEVAARIQAALSAVDEAPNMWGTRRADVGEGFCRECERDLPHHYQNCPVKIGKAELLH